MHLRSLAVVAVVLLNGFLALAASLSREHVRDADSHLGVRQYLEGIENWMNVTSSEAGIVSVALSQDSESYTRSSLSGTSTSVLR